MATPTHVPEPGAEPRIRDGAAILGILGVLAGLWWLADGEELGFDRGAWLTALVGWLPETLPAAVIVGGGWALTLATGAAVARWARRQPFATLEDALLEGFIGAVLLDVALLFLLGPLG